MLLDVAKQGGEFLPNIPDPRYPIFFSPAAGFRSLFLLLSRFVARRRRKILTFHASETQFYLRKSMFYCQNTKIFASRRSLSDRSQDVAKQGGEFLRRGGIFTRNTTDTSNNFCGIVSDLVWISSVNFRKTSVFREKSDLESMFFHPL